MKSKEKWSKQRALSLLKQWIKDNKWQGTAHFRRHNTSLYEYLYRTIGMNNAFKEIGLDYTDFKKSQGKRIIQRKDSEVIYDLYNLIHQNKWQDAKHLQLNDSRFYRELSRIGFPEAFSRIGLDYRDYRYAIWSEKNILEELKNIVDNGEWKGTRHLKSYHPSLYNAISRQMGFHEAFNKINKDYEDYRRDK